MAVLVAGLVVAGLCRDDRTASATSFAPTDARAVSGKQPNVVLISLDTTRADALHIYGNKHIETPHMDSIGNAGVVFRNHMVQVPLTLPSHASIFTGNLPAKHGVHDNGRFRLPVDQPTIASLLKTHGYRTAAFVSSIVLDHRFGLDRGFDLYDDRVGARQKADEIEEHERIGQETADAAVEWLRGQRDRPFFLFVHFYDPHAVYHARGKYSRYKNKYHAEIAYVDEQVGKLLAALAPFRDNTLIALTADHGEGLGQHDELSHGLFLYDSTMHVPFLISGPGIAGGKQITTQTRSIDILPTILALAGRSVPPGIDGRSLVPLIQGGSWTESEGIAESHYGRSMRWSPLYSLRTSEWKYIHAPKPELYHLAVDPAETRNVLAENKAVAHRMQQRVLPYRRNALEKKQNKVEDPELQEKLRSLGYISGGADPAADENLPDPKDKLEVWKHYEKALFAFYDGKPEEAAKLLHEAIRIDDSIAVLYDTLAKMGYRSDVEKQIEYLRKAAELEPEDPSFHHKLAVCYRKIRQFENSIQEAEIALRLNPKDLDTLHGLGTTYLEMGAPQKALLYFQQVLAIDSRNVPAAHQIGTCFRTLKDNARAEEYYRKAIGWNPNIPDSYNAMGVLRAEKKEYAQAEEFFLKSIDVNPEFEEAYFNLGVTYQKIGRSREAIQAFRLFLERAKPSDYASRIEKARRWIEENSGPGV